MFMLMILVISKPTRRIIVIMTLLVMVAIVFAHFYYKNINEASDPRVLDTKLWYKEYNQYAEQNNYRKVFEVLDSIQKCLDKVDHYKDSYEMGVVLNNKAAAILTLALYKDSIAEEHLSRCTYADLSKDSLFTIAEFYTKKSIAIYENWLNTFRELNENEIRFLIQNDFSEEDPAFKGQDVNKCSKKRIREIQLAQKETPRRLSVSYTNLGIIERHRGLIEEAITHYKQAIELWDRNLAAKNNLNVLLGKPMEKRSLLEKLFPPDRKK